MNTRNHKARLLAGIGALGAAWLAHSAAGTEAPLPLERAAVALDCEARLRAELADYADSLNARVAATLARDLEARATRSDFE